MYFILEENVIKISVYCIRFKGRTSVYSLNSLLSTHLKDKIITAFLKFQTPTPPHILDIFDCKHKYFKDGGLRRVQRVTLRLYTNKQLFTPIDSKVALVNTLPIPYMESINNSSTSYVRIVPSTVCGCIWAFYIHFHAFSLIKTELNENTHQMLWNISIASFR